MTCFRKETYYKKGPMSMIDRASPRPRLIAERSCTGCFLSGMAFLQDGLSHLLREIECNGISIQIRPLRPNGRDPA